MKKLLVVLSLAMAAFSFQASAATFTITDTANSVISSGTNSAAGSLSFTGPFSSGFNFFSSDAGTASFEVKATPSIKFAVNVFDSTLTLLLSFTESTLDKVFNLSFLANDPLFIEVISASNLGPNRVTDMSLSANAVPVPAAVWLFGSALMGLTGMKRRKSA
ncbi:VPLPA-CTERM sorting domain-containing protein [Methyloglobulus sp.]|uniref:VPLPA-CTERM sorting domain-containing protein n=1 Tax=Methyloglobulus sp. TaxID=2518622 RepID=UPI0032B7F740